MKRGIHPQLMNTKVTCLGCKTSFETVSTVEAIDVEICSACHPFYTGKQKLVDTAGRVDRFRAKTEAAKTRSAKKKIKQPKSRQREDNQAQLTLVQNKSKAHVDKAYKKPVKKQDEEE